MKILSKCGYFFHDDQSLQVWRWLWEASHAIEKEDRPILMDIAKKLVYFTTEDDFNKFLNNLPKLKIILKYPQFVRYYSVIIVIGLFLPCTTFMVWNVLDFSISL